jgi:signal transduction histidine kinase
MERTVSRVRAAEDIVRRDRDRLRLVVENIGDPIIVADNSAKVVLLDPLAKELFGIGESGRHPELLRNQAKLDAYLTSFTFSFAAKENKSLYLYQPSSRSEIEYAARSAKIYDECGQVAFTVTVLRDYSTWKKLEQLQLERRVLEMEKFAAAGRLVGTIAHEINNSLESIKNAIYLLGHGLDKKSKPIYDVLKKETEHLTRIARQMLGLQRNALILSNFDLDAVVEDTLTLSARHLAKNRITLEKQLGKVRQFKGSADQFRQLLTNLVVNACDSMPSGGKLIVRTRQKLSKDGLHGSVSLTIADTGTGIPRESQKSMFEPFVSTKASKGTGLGLWIVKGIVENHHGRIKVRSSVGKGTIIRLTFPVSRELAWARSKVG